MTEKRKHSTKWTIFILIMMTALAVLCLTGCGNDEKPINSLSDMKDRTMTIGMPDDFALADKLNELCPNVTIEPQNDLLAVRAVAEGKLDGFVAGRFHLERAIREGNISGVKIIDEPLEVNRCALGLSELCTVPDYENRVNECIEKMMEDGTLDDMYNRWFDEENEVMPDIPEAENPEYTLKVVTFGQFKPYSFVKDGELTGFDVELAKRVALEMNMGMKLERADYPAMLMGLSTGKYDMISANLYVTESREENTIFSTPYDEVEICLIVHDDGANAGNSRGFMGTLKKGLKNTFVEEGRWKMIISGLITTLIITVFGFALANLLGGGLCACAMSRRRGWNIVSDVYQRIVQGTPMVVILMLLYYVVFGSSSVSGVLIAIIGFGLASGASLAQQFQVAITAVDNGQKEAALALGFTKVQSYIRIVFPQAVRIVLPGYFAEVIGLMKGTAIVGYVAVTDLTKASDLIRASTYDAFIPLLSVAVIYFLIAFAILSIMKGLQKKLAKKREANKEVS